MGFEGSADLCEQIEAEELLVGETRYGQISLTKDAAPRPDGYPWVRHRRRKAIRTQSF